MKLILKRRKEMMGELKKTAHHTDHHQRKESRIKKRRIING